MGEKASFIVTQDQGQFLMEMCISPHIGEGKGFPAKLSSHSFNDRERARNMRHIDRMYEALRLKSPLCIRLHEARFGPPENWVEDFIQGERFPIPIKRLNPEASAKTEVEIHLDSKALWGAKWCLLLAMHPESPAIKNPAYQSEVLWPLAHELRSVKWLERMIGLNEASELVHEFDDAEEKAEKGAEKAKE